MSYNQITLKIEKLYKEMAAAGLPGVEVLPKKKKVIKKYKEPIQVEDIMINEYLKYLQEGKFWDGAKSVVKKNYAGHRWVYNKLQKAVKGKMANVARINARNASGANVRRGAPSQKPGDWGKQQMTKKNKQKQQVVKKSKPSRQPSDNNKKSEKLQWAKQLFNQKKSKTKQAKKALAQRKQSNKQRGWFG